MYRALVQFTARHSWAQGACFKAYATAQDHYAPTVAEWSKNQVLPIPPSILTRLPSAPCGDALKIVQCCIAQRLGVGQEGRVMLLGLTDGLHDRPLLSPAAVDPADMQRGAERVAVEEGGVHECRFIAR